jgi:hypothetical protein
MTPLDERKKTTKADDIKNFLIQGRFKNTTEQKPKKNQMKHLIPKKKKRK